MVTTLKRKPGLTPIVIVLDVGFRRGVGNVMRKCIRITSLDRERDMVMRPYHVTK